MMRKNNLAPSRPRVAPVLAAGWHRLLLGLSLLLVLTRLLVLPCL